MPEPDLKPDEYPWLLTAGQILRGEFNESTGSEIKSLRMGLRGINHPVCQKAMKALDKLDRKIRKEIE